MKRILIVLILVAAVGSGAWFFFIRGDETTVKYKTAKIERGSLESHVSATGTLNAVVTVQVGSQVSGTIKELHADFNSIVKEREVIAVLDQKTFIAQRDQAQANLVNAKANVEKAQADLFDKKKRLERVTNLYNEGLIASSEHDSAEAAYLSAEAQLRSAKAQVEQHRATLDLSEVNLEYTVIRSPVDGIVISRNVDIGQTVAASFQTPTLFTIAKDLTKMQVNANVDEADIGSVRVRQKTTFTVDAYPDRIFEGVVSQVRNAPVIIQNVVTYDVIIEVDNSDLLLKPGMTANVSVMTYRRDNVLKAPNTALRFRPAEGSIKTTGQKKDTTVWMLAGKRLEPISIKTGFSDGNYTEILEGDIKEGDAVVVEAISKKPDTGKTGTSRFHRFLR